MYKIIQNLDLSEGMNFSLWKGYEYFISQYKFTYRETDYDLSYLDFLQEMIDLNAR